MKLILVLFGTRSLPFLKYMDSTCFLQLYFEGIEITSSEESSRAREMEKQSTQLASVMTPLKIGTIISEHKMISCNLSQIHTNTYTCTHTKREQSKSIMHISYSPSSWCILLKFNLGPFFPLSVLMKWNTHFYFIFWDSLQVTDIKFTITLLSNIV